MTKRIVIILYLIMFIVAFFYREHLLLWLSTNSVIHLPYMFGLSVLLASIPVVPFTFFGALMGVKFGIMVGFFINWFGAMSAAIIYYLLARYTFSGYMNTYINRNKYLHEFSRRMEKNAFLAIVFVRVLPLIPPPLVHLYCGSLRISLPTYIFASGIGKIPTAFLLAYGGSFLFSSLRHIFLVILCYLLFIFLTLLLYRIWGTKQRLS